MLRFFQLGMCVGGGGWGCALGMRVFVWLRVCVGRCGGYMRGMCGCGWRGGGGGDPCACVFILCMLFHPMAFWGCVGGEYEK